MKETVTRLPDSHIREAVKNLKEDFDLTDFEALQIVTRLHKNRILEDAFGVELPSQGKSFLEKIAMNIGNN